MKTSSSTLGALALVLLAGLCAALPVAAFNQNHFFVHRHLTGQFNQCMGVAVGPDEKVYCADYNNSRIAIYDPDLNYLSQITGFNPHDVAVAENGVIYAPVPNQNKMLVFDATGAPLPDMATGFAAHYVRLHPVNGNIYVRDNGGQNRIYQPDGTLVKSFTLPDHGQYAVLPDGRLHLESGTIYNDLGIKEQEGLPIGFIVYSGGVCYVGRNFSGGWIRLFTRDFTEIASYGQLFAGWPDFVSRFAVNKKGDIITTDGGAQLWLIRRCEGASMGPVTRNAPPIVDVMSIAQRPNTTLLDLDYKVTDLDDATVHTAPAAFIGPWTSLDNLILPSAAALVEGTAANMGPAIPTSAVKRVTWDVSADWDADFGDVSVHVFARDARASLMGLHFLDLPAEGAAPAMQITRTPLHVNWFLEPLIWLAASGNPTVVFSRSGGAGSIHGTNDAPEAFRGELLATGSTVTLKGRQFIQALMNTREATAQEVQWAREAATPGIVNAWEVAPNLTEGVLKTIDGDRPRKLNEYSFDTGSYDANWVWLIQP